MAGVTQTSGDIGAARLGGAQLRAIAWLRWRILANSFRRRGGMGEFVGRLLLLPIFLALALLPTVLAGFLAWTFAQEGSWNRLSLVFWGTFGLTQLLNINLGQPGTTFDPTELIRFPMALRSYILVRLSFGLLSPANVLVTLMSAAVFVGVTVARPAIWPFALAATAAFAAANVLFSRMLFAWIDRWLSTRRAREIFTALIFAGSLLVQYVNVTYNPGFQHGRHRGAATEKMQHAQRIYHQAHGWLVGLPPELAGASMLAARQGRFAASLTDAALVACYGALFLGVYTLRMRTEYRGENLSDQANAVRAPARNAASPQAHAPAVPAPGATSSIAAGKRRAFPFLAPLLGKEVLTLRRNTGLLYGIIAPTVMVFLFAGRLSFRGASHWLLLMAVGYALLGIAPLSYNSFGLEGPGAQFYFMAPVSLREVFFAKNLMQLLLALFEVAVVIVIVAFTAGRPSLRDVLFVSLWALGALLLNLALGNLRSVSAPKQVKPGRTMNRAQSQVSAWIAIGVLGACAGLAFGVEVLALYLHLPWLSVALIAVFAAAGLIVYQQGLRQIGSYAMDRRESLFEELGKKT